MKTQKILASLFLIFPTCLYLISSFAAAAFHTPFSNFYIFIPLILIGISISLYKYNRIVILLSITVLIALIILFVYSSAHDIVTGGYSFIGYSQILMVRLQLVATLCFVYPLNLMLKMVINNKKKLN